MPELGNRSPGLFGPMKRRHSGSSSGRSRSRSRERQASPAAHKHNGTDERKWKGAETRERNRNRFRVASRSRSRSRDREKNSWGNDRGYHAGSRSDYYEKRDDIQRQRQEAFIARSFALKSLWSREHI